MVCTLTVQGSPSVAGFEILAVSNVKSASKGSNLKRMFKAV
jgi:hypothetical protein